MAGEQVKTQTVVIPTPARGITTELPEINLDYSLSPYNGFSYNRNYLPITGVLKAIGKPELKVNFPSEATPGDANIQTLHRWQAADGTERIIACSKVKIFSITAAYTSTNITGAVTITNGYASSCAFNDNLFLANGGDPVVAISLAQTSSNPAFTGPTSTADLNFVWSYKSRLYFIENNSNRYWYGDVDAIAGALTPVDLETIFIKPSKLRAAATWSPNQDTEENYNVFVSAAGEILIYSGDYPASPNWRLVQRVFADNLIDKFSLSPFGGDLLLFLGSGLKTLSSLVASSASPGGSFSLSQSLNSLFYNSSSDFSIPQQGLVVQHQKQPLMFLNEPREQGSSTNFLVFNYQTGAWGSFFPNGTGKSGPLLTIFNTFVFTESQTLYALNDAKSSGSRSFTSGYYNFGSNLKKRITRVRLLVRRGSTPSVLPIRCSILSDFDGTTNPLTNYEEQSFDFVTNLVSFAYYDFSFPAVGEYFKFFFSVYDPSASEANTEMVDEIVNYEVTYETGGVF